MKYQVTTPPAVPLLDIIDTLHHLRVDDEGEMNYVGTLIDAATRYAEERMETSLISRTLSATFYSGDTLYLPRGPIQSIVSVSVNGTVQASSTYSLEAQGNADILRFNNGTIQPLAAPATLTVRYIAGYGDTPESVPQDLQQVIRCHVGLLYENRELASEGTMNPVSFLDDFYRLRSRGTGVG